MMKEISVNEVERVAEDAQTKGKLWHFHMLTPNCAFNLRKDRHALVLEVKGRDEVLVAYTANRPAEIGKRLVSMLHGTQVLKSVANIAKTDNKIAASIIERAKYLNSKGISWHHHMLFPECIFNQNVGKWNLSFEDPEKAETLVALYDEEPIGDLKEVEVLFYAQSK